MCYVGGTRCTECGDVRWSIFSARTDATAPCIVCGGEVVRERRYPGRDRRRSRAAARAERRVAVDRREAPVLPSR
jgi:hypothetical protein